MELARTENNNKPLGLAARALFSPSPYSDPRDRDSLHDVLRSWSEEVAVDMVKLRRPDVPLAVQMRPQPTRPQPRPVAEQDPV